MLLLLCKYSMFVFIKEWFFCIVKYIEPFVSYCSQKAINSASEVISDEFYRIRSVALAISPKAVLVLYGVPH